jgi:hypothetical protein
MFSIEGVQKGRQKCLSGCVVKIDIRCITKQASSPNETDGEAWNTKGLMMTSGIVLVKSEVTTQYKIDTFTLAGTPCPPPPMRRKKMVVFAVEQHDRINQYAFCQHCQYLFNCQYC